MKNNKNNNSGFTLVELIIAMAVLAFLMTAVGTLMGSSVASHRKQKAEIRVHTSAQQTYNQITDSIMQSKEVVIVGYESSTPYNFSVPGADMGATPALTYYVKDSEMVEYLKLNPKVFGLGSFDTTAKIKYFSDLDADDVIYVKKIAIMTSAPIDLNYVPGETLNGSGGYSMKNTFATGGPVSEDVSMIRVASSSDYVFQANDDMVNIYTFEGSNMYYEKQYKYMTDLNDVVDPVDSSLTASTKQTCIYNTGLSYVKTTGTSPAEISGCTVTVDVKDGAIGVNLMFNDKNMTYTTNGMINLRNSYVLKGKDN